MLPSCWQNELRQIIFNQASDDQRPTLFVGVGRVENGDDGAGVAVVSRLQAHNINAGRFRFIDAGAAPENLLSALFRPNPQLVIFIDAAQMGLEPGCVRLIQLDEISSQPTVTHGISFGIIGKYLQDEVGCRVMVLGIQPQSNQPNTTLSRVISDVVQQVSDSLDALVRDVNRGKCITC